MFRAAVPVDVSVTVRVTVLPTVVCPKSIEVDESERFATGTASPLPLNGTFAVLPLALVDNARFPLKEFTASGANITVITSCCPGFSVTGQLFTPDGHATDAIWKSCPAIAPEEIVTGAVPDEVRVS